MLTVPDPVDPPDEVVKNVVPVEVVARVTVADEPVLTTTLPPESSDLDHEGGSSRPPEPRPASSGRT